MELQQVEHLHVGETEADVLGGLMIKEDCSGDELANFKHDPVRGGDRRAVDRFTRELAPLVLSGPPGATGYGGEGRPKVREVVGNWGALIPREEIRATVEVLE